MKNSLESRLARTPRAPLDPAWRALVLPAAEPRPTAAGIHRPPASGFNWTYAWASLGAAWLAILLLGFLSPEAHLPGATSVPGAPNFSDWRAHWETRRQLLGTLLNDGPLPELSPIRPTTPSTSRPRGAIPAPGFGQQRRPAFAHHA